MFVDQVKITLLAGSGGNGCLSFRHEKDLPKGGPDGGRGGDGGSIFLVSQKNIGSLSYFRFHPINKAKKGTHGQGSKRQGKKGADLFLSVPVGTVVKKENSEEILFDFTLPGQKFLAAQGGTGGRGNAFFATATRRAPRIWEKGKPGNEEVFILELRLIADAGLIGFPNAGKSTIISKISAAKPLIADYPFTTLAPNLGVVDVDESKSFVVADIPGLIEGAHKGQGLGIQFLKHVRRTKVLVHVIDVSPYTGRDPVRDYGTIIKELESFDKELLERKQILVANKMDLVSQGDSRVVHIKKLAAEENLPFLAVSAVKNTGLKAMVAMIAEMLNEPEEKHAET